MRKPGEMLYSVGAVARDTGIRQDTLRAWERRYGRPVPVRLPSGHRRFTHEQLLYLRQISYLMSLGHRPGKLLKMDPQQLPEPNKDTEVPQPAAGALAPLLEAARRMDPVELRHLLELSQREQGLLPWLNGVVAPFVTTLGEEWASGGISIRHEHLASEVLSAHLQAELARITPTSQRAPVLLTTLPGEQHALGLSMAALVVASLGFPVRVAGPDLPIDEILVACQETGADSVGISVSLSGGGVQCDAVLRELRAELPQSIELVVGGDGARGRRRGVRNVRYLASLDELAEWCRGRI